MDDQPARYDDAGRRYAVTWLDGETIADEATLAATIAAAVNVTNRRLHEHRAAKAGKAAADAG